MSGWAAAGLVGLGALVLLTGCESNKAKSARLAKQGEQAFTQKGVVVTRQNPDVEVVSTQALQDGNGAAAVVALRNRSRRALANLPVSIDVRDRGGKSVFKNDDPGLEPSLVTASLLAPGEQLLWVNDQVSPAGKVRSVDAKVGTSDAKPPARRPRIDLSTPRLEEDSVSGVLIESHAMNRSRILQRDLIIHAFARQGGRIVAAGRAQIERLRPARRARFEVFFIGDPRGAQITLSAPPTTFK